MDKDVLTGRKVISRHISRDGLRRRNRALSTILEIGGSLSECRTLDEVLSLAATQVVNRFNFEAVRIYLMDPLGLYLNLAVSNGVETSGLERIRLGEGFSGRSAASRSFIAHRVGELEDRNRMRLLTRKGFKVIVCVPLIAMDKVIGVMNLGAKKDIRLDEEMVDLLTAAGNQIAIGIGNARLLEELNAKVGELQEQKDKFKVFAYSTLHDLKSPASGVYGLAKRLKGMPDKVLLEKGPDYCSHILLASRHLLDLVEKLNAFISSSEAPLHFEKLRPRDLVDELEAEFLTEMADRKIKLTRPGKNQVVTADRHTLMRALRNLIENSLKYGGVGLSRIRVSCRVDADCFVISVADDGVGIPPAAADRLFEMFHREKSSVGVEGSGMGLAIVKEAANRHNGKLWLESRKNRGATFNISISRNLA